ncbi:NAD-dependent epimerase/dehydratase family protein [Streptomyces kanamyceticus]|uniref:NAD-dependent epimerase/dehydratase family protein n=1 Tax=Streptomyces kanamyceticus TaxID=1967 RepID=UPI0037DC16C7
MSHYTAPRALVLGGAGFVGRHVCAAFTAAGYQVVAVSRRPRPHAPGVLGVSLDLLAAEPREITALLRAIGPAVVVNATGAVWDVTVRQLTDVNVHLVERLAGSLGALSTRPRLVHLGSVHEYGAVPHGAAIDEGVPECPSTSYGRTKLRGSRVVLDATAAGLLDAVVLRISNVVGPGTPRGSLLGRVAGQLADAAERGEPARLRLTPLRAKRDFVDVCDVTDAVVTAARRPVSGRVLNLGRGEAVGVRRMVDGLISASGIEARVVEEGGQEARSEGVEWQQVDCAAARAALGWVPRRRLEDSLRALWEETREHCRASRAS